MYGMSRVRHNAGAKCPKHHYKPLLLLNRAPPLSPFTQAKGDSSALHIIIFDEIDAICKQRGSVRDGSGVHDTVVNQLLTKVRMGFTITESALDYKHGRGLVPGIMAVVCHPDRLVRW